MKKLVTNSFILAFVALVIFRVLIYFMGLGTDGNFLILVIGPFLIFWMAIVLIKYVYAKLSMNQRKQLQK